MYNIQMHSCVCFLDDISNVVPIKYLSTNCHTNNIYTANIFEEYLHYDVQLLYILHVTAHELFVLRYIGYRLGY